MSFFRTNTMLSSGCRGNNLPFALNELGKISDGIAHGTGPQLAPKLNI